MTLYMLSIFYSEKPCGQCYKRKLVIAQIHGKILIGDIIREMS